MSGAIPIIAGAALGAVSGGVGLASMASGATELTFSGFSGMGALTGAMGGINLAGATTAAEGKSAAYEYNAAIEARNAAIASDTAEFNARVAEAESINAGRIGEYNAQLYEQNAIAAQKAAEYNAGVAAIQSKKDRAAQVARFAAGGVDVGAGTPLLVDAADQYTSDLNQQNIIYGGAVESTKQKNLANLSRYTSGVESQKFTNQAAGYRRQGNIQAIGLAGQSGLDKLLSDQSRTVGDINVGRSLLTTGKDLYSLSRN